MSDNEKENYNEEYIRDGDPTLSEPGSWQCVRADGEYDTGDWYKVRMIPKGAPRAS